MPYCGWSSGKACASRADKYGTEAPHEDTVKYFPTASGGWPSRTTKIQVPLTANVCGSIVVVS